MQCVAVCCSKLQRGVEGIAINMLQCIAVRCSFMLRCAAEYVAVCCALQSMLQYVVECCRAVLMRHSSAISADICIVWPRAVVCRAVCCSVLQCVAVCCSVLQCVAV